MEKGGYTYIMANKPRGLVYVGVTADIATRYWQHRNSQGSAYCRKWGIDRLVWYTHFLEIRDAIAHEKRVKLWVRPWKEALIERDNPKWADLGERLNG